MSDCPAEDRLSDGMHRAQELLEREFLFGVNEEKWVERENRLREALSPSAQRDERAAIFVSIRSSSLVFWGMVVALTTIGSTIASCLMSSCPEEVRREQKLDDLNSVEALRFLADPQCADLQGLVYPYISETARDMPQTGFFAFGMTISMMMMICCAILQYGKVKREIRSGTTGIPVGAKRNFTSLICGIVAPPFLGLLACYDTRRALNTHRGCVVVFFGLTIVYMFTTLSIYSYLAQVEDDPDIGSHIPSPTARKSLPLSNRLRYSGEPGRGDSARLEDHGLHEVDHPHAEKPDVHFSLRLKTYIASIFTILTTFYLPVGFL